MSEDVVTIIVNYRLAASAARAAASCLAEDVSNEIWVVDNSEDPGETATLRSLLDPRCRLLVNDRNAGFGAACNAVYARTHSEFVFLLNPDAWCEPGALADLVACLRSAPRAGGVTPRAWYDADHQVAMPFLYPYPWWHQILAERLSRPVGLAVWVWSLSWRTEALRQWQATGTMRLARAGLSGGHVLLRRAALERCGGMFDANFFLYGEDTELSHRLRAGGWELLHAPAAAVVHPFGSTARDRAEWKHQQAVNAERQLMAHFHGANLPYRLLKLANRLLRHGSWLPAVATPPRPATVTTLDVPRAWQDGWLLEVGFNPYLIPALGHLGRGPQAAIPASLAQHLPPGSYWARLGPARQAAWLKPAVASFRVLPNFSAAAGVNAPEPATAPVVSVIVRTRDRPQLLEEALYSIAQQSYPRIELVVVNDGGVDVGDAVQAYASALAATRYIHLRESRGRAGAANAGLDAATGAYLIFLDDDDLFEPGHIAGLMAAFAHDASVLAAYSGTRLHGPGGVSIWDLPYDPVRLRTFGLFAIHAVLFDRRLLTLGCRFDEVFPIYEDWDFWLQVAEQTDFVHVPQVSAIYRSFGAAGNSPFSLDLERSHLVRQKLMDKWSARWSKQELAAQVELARSFYLEAEQSRRPWVQQARQHRRSGVRRWLKALLRRVRRWIGHW